MLFRRCCLMKCLSLFLAFLLISSSIYGQTFGGISLQQQTSSTTASSKKQVQQQYTPSLSDDTTVQKASDLMPDSATMTQSDLLIQNISVHVLGDVASPGIQKVKMTERASEILKMASPNRETTRLIQIRRPGEETRYYDLYQYYYFGNLAHNPYVQEGDTIFVSQTKGAVRIEGPVARTGVYELNNEKNLEQIVRLAGGFTSSISRVEPLRVVRFADEGNKRILDVLSQESDLKNFTIQKGDVIIVPDVVTAGKAFDYSVEQVPGENMVYPTSSPYVIVMGAVQQSGTFLYKAHFTVKDYVGLAGATSDASMKSVKIVRGKKTKRVGLNDTVQAGDVIFVKTKSSQETMKYVSYISAILSVSLSAYVLKTYLEE